MTTQKPRRSFFISAALLTLISCSLFYIFTSSPMLSDPDSPRSMVAKKENIPGNIRSSGMRKPTRLPREKPFFLFKPGHRHLFSFRQNSKETVTPVSPPGMNTAAAPAIKGDLALTGHFEIRAFSSEAKRVALVFTQLEQALLRVNDQVIPEVKNTLLHEVMELEYDDQGRFVRYFTRPDAPSLAVQTLRAFAMRLSIASPKIPLALRWKSVETLPHGEVSGEYQHMNQNLFRNREAYLSLDVSRAAGVDAQVALTAQAQFSLDEEQLVRSISDAESLGAESFGAESHKGASNETESASQQSKSISLLKSNHRLQAERQEIAEFQGQPHLDWQGRPMAEVPLSENFALRALQQQADGMTPASMIAQLKKQMNGGVLSDSHRTLFRMAAVLEMHPELAYELSRLFMESTTSSKGRALLLDLLASVGHDDAQRALREALSSRAGREDKSHGVLYQRLGLVDSPNVETIDFAADRLQNAVGGPLEDQLLAGYSAGAVAGHAREKHPDQADNLADELAALLAATDDPNEQKHWVKALGNAHRAEDQAAFAALAQGESGSVKQSVARALKDPATPTARDALLLLAGDKNPRVQSEAIRALRLHTLGPAHFTTLAEIVSVQGLPRMNRRTLLDMLKHKADESPTGVRQVLEAMQGLDLQGAVFAAVQALLDRLSPRTF